MSAESPGSKAIASASHFRLTLKGLDSPLHFKPEEFYWAQGYDRLLAAQLDWIERETERRHLQLKEYPVEVLNIALVTEGATLTAPRERAFGWQDGVKLSKAYLVLQCWYYRLCRFIELRLYRGRNRWFRYRVRLFRIRSKLSRIVRRAMARSVRPVSSALGAAVPDPAFSRSPRQSPGTLAAVKGVESGGKTDISTIHEDAACGERQPMGVAFKVAPSAAFAERIHEAVVAWKGCLVSLRESPFVLGDGMQIIRYPTTSSLSLVRHYLGMRDPDERLCIGFADARQARTTLAGLKGRLGSDDVVVTSRSAHQAVEGWGVHQDMDYGLALHSRPPGELLTSHCPAEPRNGWPKISIVTVNYNQGRYLDDCLKSILDQGYPNLEFIVVDGDSTDCSKEILRRYRDKVSTMIIEPDDGQSAALNKGFRLATGDIMNWVCSDDMLEPGSLFHIGAGYADTKADLIAGGCRVIDDAAQTKFVHHSAMPDEAVLSAGEVMKFMSSWQMGDFFFQPEVFFSRAIWEKAGAAVREHLFYAMDYDMFIRMAMARARIRSIPNIIGVSRQHAHQKTQHATMEYLPQVHGILSEFREMISACAEVGRSFDS